MIIKSLMKRDQDNWYYGKLCTKKGWTIWLWSAKIGYMVCNIVKSKLSNAFRSRTMSVLTFLNLEVEHTNLLHMVNFSCLILGPIPIKRFRLNLNLSRNSDKIFKVKYLDSVTKRQFDYIRSKESKGEWPNLSRYMQNGLLLFILKFDAR